MAQAQSTAADLATQQLHQHLNVRICEEMAAKDAELHSASVHQQQAQVHADALMQNHAVELDNTRRALETLAQN